MDGSVHVYVLYTHALRRNTVLCIHRLRLPIYVRMFVHLAGQTTRALGQQLKLLNLKHGLDSDTLALPLLLRYMHDFTCMHALHTETISRTVQVRDVVMVTWW